MPVRNEADFIARSLTAVLTQDYSHNCTEVLIVDGMSSDATRTVIASVAAKHTHIPVRILDNPRQIVPVGMNLAMSEAKGEIIVRVDGHCEIAPDYVSCCVRHLLADGVDGVGGPIETIGNTPYSETIALAMSSPFGVGGSAFRTVKDRQILVDTVAFPAYTRRAIEIAGPYDEQMVRNQDDEYSYRLRHLGFKILLAPDVHARYYSRSSLRSLWQQYFQYGFYKIRVLQRHPRQMQPRQFIPPLFVAGVLGGAVFAPFSKPIRYAWILGLALYAVANGIMSWRLASKHDAVHFKRLPVIFGTLHMSYGLGFIVGLISLVRTWLGRSISR